MRRSAAASSGVLNKGLGSDRPPIESAGARMGVVRLSAAKPVPSEQSLAVVPEARTRHTRYSNHEHPLLTGPTARWQAGR